MQVPVPSSHQFKIEKFMRLAGQQVPYAPTLPSREIRMLRATLILEEAIETINGLGFSVWDKARTENEGAKTDGAEHDLMISEVQGLDLVENHGESLMEIVDGCCDISVVT